MAYNMKAIKKEFAGKGIFYTEPELAKYVRSFLPEDVKEIYDPTCGNGGLLSVFGNEVEKFGQEINAEQLADAEKNLANFHGFCGDTLKNPAWMDRKFKYIIANPPFGIKWEPIVDVRFERIPCMPPKGCADFAFLLHILYMLDKDGIAVCMDSCGILFRNNAEGELRRWFLENNLIEKVVYIPENQFVDTKIKTCLWVLNKAKKNTDIVFIDKKTKTEKTVSFDTIKANNFNLSQNFYFKATKTLDLPPIGELLERMKNDIVGQLKACFELCRSLGSENLYGIFLEEIKQALNDAENKTVDRKEGYVE